MPNPHRKLTSKEYVLLRALAFGFGENDFCRLLYTSLSSVREKRKALMAKFEVQNEYFLVMKAKQEGYINRTNIISEDIKSRTFEFVKKHHQSFLNQIETPEKGLWGWYHLLLDYFAEMGQVHESETKKIPPKRD